MAGPFLVVDPQRKGPLPSGKERRRKEKEAPPDTVANWDLKWSM
jgi:hypothetical protein